MLDIDRMIRLKEVIKWHTVFVEADLNASTMRSAMHKRRELKPQESDAILAALTRRGVYLADEQLALFSSADSIHDE